MSVSIVSIAQGTDVTLQFFIQIGTNSIPLSARFRYSERMDKWFLSVFNTQTNEYYVANASVVTNNGGGDINDILRQFAYKKIGTCGMQGIVASDQGIDPRGDDLTRWTLLWGDPVHEQNS